MKEEFKVGDEVIDRYVPSLKGIVYNIESDFANIISTLDDGSLLPFTIEIELESCKKTGRHFDQIDALINSVALIDHFLKEE